MSILRTLLIGYNNHYKIMANNKKFTQPLLMLTFLMSAFMALPMPTLHVQAEGSGGGGGGGGGYSSISISFGGLGSATISGQHSPAGGGLTGTISGNGNFGSNPGQYSSTANYSASLGGWVSQENPYSGGGELVGGNAFPCSESDAAAAQACSRLEGPNPGYIVSQTCVDSYNVDVTFRAPGWTGDYKPPYNPNGDVSLYDGAQAFRATFGWGEVKTLRYPAGASYPNAYWRSNAAGSQMYPQFRIDVRNDCPPPPPTVTLSADPLQVDYNKPSNLTWVSGNTTTCTASGGWSGTKVLNNPTVGQLTGPLTSATTFALTCQGQPGTTPARSERTVTVRIGEGADLDVDKPIVRKDEPVILEWDIGTSLPENCILQAGSITIAGPFSQSSGSYTALITGETVFTLSCDGGQNKSSVTVRVLPEFQET